MDGKKLLVFSDSHGGVSALKTVFAWAREHLPPNDTICSAAFCGDGIADLKPAADATGFYCDWKLVSGNNDYDYLASTPSSTVFEFCGHRFFMCHGHRHNIYGNFHTLLASARTANAGVALFGHTHTPYKDINNGICIINPGSVARPRSRIGATFAVLECAEDKPINVEFWGIGEQGGIRKVKV